MTLPSLPDLLLTILSVCFLVSSSKPKIASTRCPFSCCFLKFPAMSFTATPSKNTTTVIALNTLPPRRYNFASPQSLSDWLKPRLPSESFA
ncbi:uncharacterized protein HKW66_Vig0038900 [Vigna angularis]|uniref:Secreted protein n=1 Tax=Phaseolus angularis TaxID=3914 RepID=A0A8T0LE75_PHAAN|nr:uncharacterized protein HKW66_Vig0038900 [Vigna angularis]